MTMSFLLQQGVLKLGRKSTHYLQGLKLIFGVVEVGVAIATGFLVAGVPEFEFDAATLAVVPTFP